MAVPVKYSLGKYVLVGDHLSFHSDVRVSGAPTLWTARSDAFIVDKTLDAAGIQHLRIIAVNRKCHLAAHDNGGCYEQRRCLMHK